MDNGTDEELKSFSKSSAKIIFEKLTMHAVRKFVWEIFKYAVRETHDLATENAIEYCGNIDRMLTMAAEVLIAQFDGDRGQLVECKRFVALEKLEKENKEIYTAEERLFLDEANNLQQEFLVTTLIRFMYIIEVYYPSEGRFWEFHETISHVADDNKFETTQYLVSLKSLRISFHKPVDETLIKC